MFSPFYRIMFFGCDCSNMQSVFEMLTEAQDPGFEVHCEDDLRFVLTQSASGNLDAILWDLTGLGGDGLDALHRFRSQNESVPVVVLVPENGSLLGRQALEAGAAEYLPQEIVSIDLLQRAMRYAIERNRAANEVRQWERRFEDLFENANDILFTLDLDGRITSVNKAAEEVLGWSRSQTLQKQIKSLVAPEYAVFCAEKMRRILNDEPVGHFEVGMLRQDGRTALLEVSIRVLRSNGRKTGLQGIARDVTERRQLENMVWQSQKLDAIGRLSGNLAHDFNNLLCVISGHTEFLMERLGPTDPAMKNLAQIQKAAESAATLTRQLLAFGRKQVFRPRVADLNEIVIETEKLLGRLIDEHIQLHTALGSSLGHVHVDPVQIEQVLINLALNARDAMPQGGNLTIETSNVDLDEDHRSENSLIPAGKYVLLGMTDTGYGMNEEIRSRIFEPFYTTKEFGSGNGLGLAAVYGIVQQSGGFIWVYSEEGRGTTFKVYLPRVDSPLAAAPTRERQTKVSRGTETILVVEDAEPLRALTKHFLMQSGYTVLEAANGEEAIQVAQAFEGAIDLLLTDVVMPKMSGKQLVEQMARIRPRTRVLYMSGYPNDGIAQTGLVAGRVTLVEKPFTREILSQQVRRLLDEPPQATLF